MLVRTIRVSENTTCIDRWGGAKCVRPPTPINPFCDCVYFHDLNMSRTTTTTVVVEQEQTKRASYVLMNSRNFTRWLVLQHTLRLENLSPVRVNNTAKAMSMPATVWVAPNESVIQRSWLGCKERPADGGPAAGGAEGWTKSRPKMRHSRRASGWAGGVAGWLDCLFRKLYMRQGGEGARRGREKTSTKCATTTMDRGKGYGRASSSGGEYAIQHRLGGQISRTARRHE